MKSHKSFLSAQQEFEEHTYRRGRDIFIIIIIMILSITLFCLACNDDGTTDPVQVIVTAPPVEPPIIEPPDPPQEKIILSLYTSTSLKFYDGVSIFEWKSGPTARADTGIYSHENILYYLDEYGQEISNQDLITTPDLIALDGADYYIYEHLDPVTASGMGGLYKDYSRFYQNDAEVGSWATQQYITDKIYIIDDELFARQTSGKWNAITGIKTDIQMVMPDFVMHDYDSGARTAKINGIPISWLTNFLNSTKYWQKSDTKYYSEKGHVWDGVTLSEYGDIMTDWRAQPYLTGYTESPVIIPAGIRFENLEVILYWIECNSGWVIRQVTSTNQMTLHIRLYTGDGMRTTGVFYRDLLKPVIVGGYLYYIFDAQVYRYGFVDGLNAVFTNGVSEVWGY